MEENISPEKIEVAGKTMRFQDTKIGKLHVKFINSLLDCKKVDENTIMDPETRKLLSEYLAASESSILYNMRTYMAMQKFIEDLLLCSSLTESGKVVSITFPEQKKVLQDAVDSMLTLMGKKINHETSKK